VSVNSLPGIAASAIPIQELRLKQSAILSITRSGTYLIEIFERSEFALPYFFPVGYELSNFPTIGQYQTPSTVINYHPEVN
jgi:hypothetical protein